MRGINKLSYFMPCKHFQFQTFETALGFSGTCTWKDMTRQSSENLTMLRSFSQLTLGKKEKCE